ncbi:MAG: hypothetical protein LBE84_08450 [Planctomycetota bacterium]|jgi:ferredoxin|nr:hypothetical protein [Planctomycetota bacterium]
MSNFLEERGYATVPVPARNCAIGARKPAYAMISFRHAAVAAGLATFGLSGLALTRKYGNRQRFIALPTSAPLRPADRLLEQAEVCDGCLECVRHCPAGALTLKPPHQCVIGGTPFRYAECNPDRCRIMASGLSTKVWEGAAFNPNIDVPVIENPTGAEKYDQVWNQRDARIRILEHSEATFGATHCGRCMAFCTSGHQAMKRRLRAEDRENGYTDDLVIRPDGRLHPIEPRAGEFGRELLAGH